MRIESQNVPVSDDAIAMLENVLGSKFPKQYREFLRCNNGGHPEPDCFNFADGRPGSAVRGFLKLNSSEIHDDFVWNWKTFKTRIPGDFVPIAFDAGGNLVCVAITGPHYGHVYFWDHEFESDDGEPVTMNNMALIANSFGEFLSGLYQFEQD